MVHNWKTAVAISEPPGANSTVPAWAELKFNPLGIFNLHRHLGVLAGEPGVFTRYQKNFEAADIAWFAAGASEDNDHHVAPDSFHSAFTIMRSHLPAGEEGKKWRKDLRSRLQKSTFDAVRLPSSAFINL